MIRKNLNFIILISHCMLNPSQPQVFRPREPHAAHDRPGPFVFSNEKERVQIVQRWLDYLKQLEKAKEESK